MLPDKIQNRFFLLIGLFGAIQSGVGLILLMGIPSEAKSAVLMGLSLERWIMLGGMGLLLAGFLMIGWGALKGPKWFTRFGGGLVTHLQKPKIWGTALVSCIFLFISSVFFILITPEITEIFAKAYFDRLQPFALVFAGLSGQLLIALPFLRFGLEWKQNLQAQPELMRVALLYGAILLVWGGLDLYLLRIEPDPIGWNTLGTPLLDTQVIFVFFTGLFLLFVGSTGKINDLFKTTPAITWKIDLVICLMLWVIAAVYWHTLPLQDNWYISAPRSPTFAFYPNSDGVVYDTTAQSLLSGIGYKSSYFPYPRRPLYGLFLFGLYLIKGQNFEAVVSLQSMIFAIFPALVYLAIKNMHNRLSGIIAGLLVLLREGNAMALTNVITVSHSKMAMADFPTAIGIALFMWIVFRWVNAPRRFGAILAAGGILAALMQIRVETGIFLPVVFGMSLLQWPRLKAQYFKGLLAFLFGMFLVLSPWIWRNWKMTGLVFLEVPDNRLGFLIGRLATSPEDQLVQPPAELEAEDAVTPRKKNRSLSSPPEDFPTQAEPPGLLNILTSHWIHSQVQALLLFPDTYRIFDSTIGFLGHKDPNIFWTQCCSAANYTRRLPYWEWGKWSGEIPPQSIVPVLVNLFVMTIGFHQVWKKFKWNGLLPMGFCFAYYFANGLARTSGGRYLFPVDWIWIGYYSIGLAQIIRGGFYLFGAVPRSILLDENASESETTSPQSWKTYAAISAGFLLLGLALPAAEHIIPPRYTETTLNQWMNELEQGEPAIVPQLQGFLANGGQVLQGSGNYLRYYGRDEGEPGSLYPAVYPHPYANLNIFLVGPTNIGVVLPLQDAPDIQAQNAAEVLVFGCDQPLGKANYFNALAMFYPSTGELFVREPFPAALTCPLPDP